MTPFARRRAWLLAAAAAAGAVLEGVAGFAVAPARRPVVSPRARVRRGGVKVTTLSSDEALAMGIREWPFNARPAGVFEEAVEQGTRRYVLEGAADLEVSDYAGGLPTEPSVRVAPGSLLDVEETCCLRWTHPDEDMVILTPTYEQTGALFGGLAVVVALFVALLLLAGRG